MFATYHIGPPERPPIEHDNGYLQHFKMRNATKEDRLHYAKWATILEGREALNHIPRMNNLSDALAAYRHFLHGGGRPRNFSYERYVLHDPNGKTTLNSAIKDAKEGAEDLWAGNYFNKSLDFQMTGSAIRVGDPNKIYYAHFPYPATENWQKAIGGHVIWISADIHVVFSNKEQLPNFTMKFELHAEDRYNFNPGNHDIATGIPDSENGIFEITGLANQYLNYSTLKRTVEWMGFSFSSDATARENPGRQRQPVDNLRIRNRL